MNQRIEILNIVELGPVTSQDVADDTGLPLKNCSAYLSELFSSGVLARSEFRSANNARMTYLYSIKKQ